MFLATASVKRPVAMSSLIIGLTLLGIYAYLKIGLELMPKLDIPYITVVTVFPGASPEQIETDVARRIEDQMMTLEGLKHVSSTCMENACQTLLEFNLGVNVDIAATDVREKLDLVRNEFPADVEDPKVLKFDINSKPIANLVLTGPTSVEELYDYADNNLRDKLSVIEGVADAELIGGAQREVHILIDREKLTARGLSSLEIVQTVNSAVKTIPLGRIRDFGSEISVEFNGDFSQVEKLKDLEVVNRNNGQIVFLKDIAEVKMSSEELRQQAFIGENPCISIKVVKRSDANAVKTVTALQREMNRLQSRLPPGWELQWISDDARFIQANVDSAWENILQGIVLTALILFFFLYDLKTLLIAAITMPLNIVIGFLLMYFMDYTLNLSTLISIGLSVGILVTNALVVLEAIMKKLEETGDPKIAAIEGTSACTVEVIASSGTNIVVLFPIAQLGGVIGLFLKPLANTMLIMTVVSVFLSFTLIPLLASLLLKKDHDKTSPLRRIEACFNRGLQAVIRKYTELLTWGQNNMAVTGIFLVFCVVMLIHSLTLAGKVGGGFMPTADMANVGVKLEFPTSYSLDKTRNRVMEAVKLARELPEVKSVLSGIGKVEGGFGRSSDGVYLGELKLRLSDKDQRKISLEEFLRLLEKRFASFTDAIVTISIPSPAGGSDAPLQIEFAGESLSTLDQIATDLKKVAETIPGFTSADTTVRSGKPKIRITPRRDVLSQAQIPAVSLGTSLRGNLEGIKAATFKKADRNYDIVVKFAEQQGTKQVEDYTFAAHDGKSVPLTTFGQVEKVIAPIQIIRKDKQRISKFESYLSRSLPLGTAVSRLSAIIEKDILPAGYSFKISGQSEMMGEAQQNLAEAAVIAMILVILTLSAVMESFIQPALILLTLPPTLIGMLWALYLTGYSISIFVIMGGVMLIGIVVNNAILIIEHFNHLVQDEKVAPRKAIIQAAGERFRPVVMITLAAILGMLPMAFGAGIGSELRCDIGVASAGGILSSALISIFLIPLVGSLFLRKEESSAAAEN